MQKICFPQSIPKFNYLDKYVPTEKLFKMRNEQNKIIIHPCVESLEISMDPLLRKRSFDQSY